MDIEAVLAGWDKQFDRETQLMRSEVWEVRYHTRLQPGTPVRSTRESAIYAAALLATDNPERQARGIDVWRALLPLQTTAEGHPYRGVWPWFYEEPLTEMSPPDRNWADFIGVQAAQTLLRGRERLPADLRPGVERALSLAAHSIRERNIRLSYSNIAIMGTYVTVTAGALLGDATLSVYGKDRLRRFVDFTRNYGGFPEYNSPYYLLVCLLELSRMLRDFQDDEDRELAREVHDLAWRQVAVHWHAPSRQWAGPHCRSYSTLVKPEIVSFLQRGVGERGKIVEAAVPPTPDEFFLPLRCPDDCAGLFLETSPKRNYQFPISEARPPLRARMHMEPGYVLSSAQRISLWNQSRGLTAYAPPAEKPAAATVRFLHDGYDFCSANLLCEQKHGRVLAGVCLAYDAGDTHGGLDKYPDRKLAASDWRLRIEFFNLDEASLRGDWSFGGKRVIPFGGSAFLGVSFLAGLFGPEAPRFAVGGEGERSWVDLIFYEGEKREFHFEESFPSHAALALMIAPTREEAAAVGDATAVLHDRRLDLSWPNGGSSLRFPIPAHPLAEAEISQWAHAKMGGDS